MKFKASFVIIIISILLCCSIVGSAFALYSVDAEDLNFTFSGLFQEPINYFLKITKGSEEIQSIKLIDGETATTHYESSLYLETDYTMTFYKNNDPISVNYSTSSDLDAGKKPKYSFNYDFTFDLSETNPTVSVVADKTSYYIVGDNNGWTITGDKAIKLVANPGNSSEVMATGIPFALHQGFKIRNYQGYYATVNSAVNALWTSSSDGNIVMRAAGNYDFYFNTSNKSVYFALSNVTLTKITSYQNASWILDGNAWLVALGSDGNFYKITYTNWGYNDITVEVWVPSNLASVTLWRASPSINYESFKTASTSYKWNNVTINRSSYGSTNKIWS